MTRRSGSGNGSGRSKIALTTEKSAVVAPIASVSVHSVTNVKAGLRSS
jgi:hypothetical protein